MKWDYLKEDFSAGEITPKLQGAVTTDIYKAACERIVNAMPGRGKSVESRAGGFALADPVAAGDAGVGTLPSGFAAQTQQGTPVQHVAIPDGPAGAVVAEIGPWYVRLLDRTGVVSWTSGIDLSLDGFAAGGVGGWSFAGGAPSDMWGDKNSGTVYLNNSDGTASRALVTPLIPACVGTPVGTDEGWTFQYRLAGDSVTLRVTVGAGHVDFVLTRGTGTVNFLPGGDFTLSLVGVGGQKAASTLWDLKLFKDGEQMMSAPFASSQVAKLNKVRASQGFWFNNQFWVVLVGLDNLYALRWTSPTNPILVGTRKSSWEFVPLPFSVYGSTFSQADVTAVAVYQNRLWLGVGDAVGTLFASEVGYGPVNAFGGAFFRFGRVETDYVGDGVKTDFLLYVTTMTAPPTGGSISDLLFVSVNGVQLASSAFLTTPRYDANGNISAENVHIIAGAPAVGQAVIIRRSDGLVTASDPMDLKLATPMGRIVWLQVLHGLVLGSTRAERTFQQTTLSIDPATGGDFDLLDHSSTGSDAALPAIPVNEKLLFMTPGRKLLRSMAVRFLWEQGLPQGGLISEDVSMLGEHLLRKGVRSFCYVKSPVERMVFVFDDGTAAIATMNPQFGLTWSRLVIPAALGGVFAVCSLDVSDNSTELFIGTESGVTLWWKTLESDITHKTLYTPAVWPSAPTHRLYDDETPLPPVMDGWSRVPLFRSENDITVNGVNGGAGVSRRTGISSTLLNQQAWLLLAGQVFGPFAIYDHGGNDLRLQGAWTALAAAGFTDSFRWTDATGTLRAGECYVGLAYPEHRATTVPLEGGNPRGTSQGYKSRKPQLYVRLVDSYVPKVNGNRSPERDGTTTVDLLGQRWSDDLRFTEMGFTRAAVVDVVMEVPLRMEFSAIFGGTMTASL